MNIEVCLQDVYDRVIGHTPAVRETPPLQKGHIFISHSFSELVQKPGFPHPRLGQDGKGLPPSPLGAL